MYTFFYFSDCLHSASGNEDNQSCQICIKLFIFQINTDEDRLHTVLGDLSQRRSHINNIMTRRNIKLVDVVTPLAELKGYSTDLRTITSGTATFTMELSHYQQMSLEDQNRVIESFTGFAPS